jgi:hypothetical protein
MLKRRHNWLILFDDPVPAELWQFLSRLRAGRHGRRASARARKRARPCRVEADLQESGLGVGRLPIDRNRGRVAWVTGSIVRARLGTVLSAVHERRCMGGMAQMQRAGGVGVGEDAGSRIASLP